MLFKMSNLVKIIVLILCMSCVYGDDVPTNVLDTIHCDADFEAVLKVENGLLSNAMTSLMKTIDDMEEVDEDSSCEANKTLSCARFASGVVASCIVMVSKEDGGGIEELVPCITKDMNLDAPCYSCLCAVLQLLGAVPDECTCTDAEIVCPEDRVGHAVNFHWDHDHGVHLDWELGGGLNWNPHHGLHVDPTSLWGNSWGNNWGGGWGNNLGGGWGSNWGGGWGSSLWALDFGSFGHHHHHHDDHHHH